MKKKLYVVTDIFNNDLNVEAWLEMVEHRQEKNNAYTPLGAKKAMIKLARYSHQIQQKAVDRAIESGWTGVFPESEQQEVSLMEKTTDKSWADHMITKDNLIS